MINIPEEYWTGAHTVKCRLPYLTPPSIHRLDELLKPSFTVLEFGSGGSTLFFAQRCKRVISVEPYQHWINILTAEASEVGLQNITFHNYTDRATLAEFLKPIEDGSVDVLLVDSDDYWFRDLDYELPDGQPSIRSRTVLTEMAMPKLNPSGFYVLDNYDRPWYKIPLDPSIWNVEKYDDSHWDGRGTLIAHRKTI